MPRIGFDDPEGTHSLLRDSVETLCSRLPGAASVRKKRAAGADTDAALWRAMTEAGWMGLLLPEALGGSGLGLADQAVLSESLGRALVCEPVATGAVVAATLLADAPASPQRDRLAAGLADGSAIVAPAWQRAAAGQDGSHMVARPENGGYLLSGECHYVEQAEAATNFLVVAETEAGAALFSLPAAARGPALRSRAGVDGATIASLACERSFVSAEARLTSAGTGAELLERAIFNARVALSAELAGIASRALELTIGYTRERVQFGRPIASFQVIQHRLVEMWSDAEFACAAVVKAVEMPATANARDRHMAVLAAKARAGDAAVSICRRAVHLHGAMGFTDECDIGLYLKRAISLNATLGQPEALRLEFVRLERAA